MAKLSCRIAAALALALPLAGAAQEQPGAFKIPGTDTTLKVYGYVQLSTTLDLSGRQDPNAEWAGAAAIMPLQGDAAFKQKPQFFWSSQPSRFGFTTTTPTPIGDVGTKVEGDFKYAFVGTTAANGNGFRMRHAYGTLGSYLLIGQQWSTFIDVATYPDTVDFNPPLNNPLIRQPQVRVTVPLGGASLALAAESSASSFTGLVGSSKGAFDAMPDFVANLTVPWSFGHVSARALTMNYRNVNHAKQGVAGALSGSLKFRGDTLVWEVQGGHGIGRYMFGTLLGKQDATDDGNKILLWDALGYHVGFTHVWSPRFRSNLIWSQYFVRGDGRTETAAAVALAKPGGSFNHRVEEAYVNTFWTVTKTFALGLEYTWARRHTFGGDFGTQNRINAAAKFNIF